MSNPKNKKEKIEEPYSPIYTPNPPQIIDPRVIPEKNKNIKTGNENEKTDTRNQSKPQKDKEDNPKRLGESETEIDDETTI